MYINIWDMWEFTSKLKINCRLIIFYVAVGLYSADISYIIKKLLLGS